MLRACGVSQICKRLHQRFPSLRNLELEGVIGNYQKVASFFWFLKTPFVGSPLKNCPLLVYKGLKLDTSDEDRLKKKLPKLWPLTKSHSAAQFNKLKRRRFCAQLAREIGGQMNALESVLFWMILKLGFGLQQRTNGCLRVLLVRIRFNSNLFLRCELRMNSIITY